MTVDVGVKTETTVTLICAVQNCKLGPFFTVGETNFHDLNGSCAQAVSLDAPIDSNEALMKGVMYVEKTLSLQDIINTTATDKMNFSDVILIPVKCRTLHKNSSISFIHIITKNAPSTTTEVGVTDFTSYNCNNSIIITEDINSVKTNSVLGHNIIIPSVYFHYLLTFMMYFALF